MDTSRSFSARPPRWAPSLPRRVAAAGALVLATLLGTFAAPSARSATAEVKAERDGFWTKANGGGGVLILNTVPANAIGVGATAGDADKDAAIGMVLNLGEDVLLDKLLLKLREAPGTAANTNAAAAGVMACPITGGWNPSRNGLWNDRPQRACDRASATGTRAADGSWQFDLTPIARLWADASNPLPQGGIVLTEKVDAPVSFQLSYLDVANGGVVLELTTTDVSAPSPVTETIVVTSAPPTETFDFGAPTFLPEPVGGAPLPIPTPAAPAAPPVRLVAPAAQRQAEGPEAGNMLGNLSPGGLLLFPIVLGLALVASYTLGPAGDPAATTRRHGGVSRVLARRQAEVATRQPVSLEEVS